MGSEEGTSCLEVEEPTLEIEERERVKVMTSGGKMVQSCKDV